MTRERFLLLTCLFSGFFGINYEMLYFRLLTSQFGDLVHVHAAILATFLFGIAIGARCAWRIKRFLWALEIGVGLAALLIVSVIRESFWIEFIGGSVLRTVLGCTVVVIVPAILTGFSIPLFAEYLQDLRGKTDKEEPSGEVFPIVYYLYNVGAAVSVLFTEYLIVRNFGHSGTLFGLALGNISIGLFLFLFFPDLRKRGARNDSSDRKPISEVQGERSSKIVAFLFGVSSSAFQIFFVRACVEIIGPTREIFALTLTLTLVGLSIGVSLARRITMRQLAALLTFSISAGCLLIPTLWQIYNHGLGIVGGIEFQLMRIVWRLIVLSFLALLPLSLFGALLPVLLKQGNHSAERIGLMMFWNGLGNAIGYLCYIGVLTRIGTEYWQILIILLTSWVASLVYIHSRRAIPVSNSFWRPAAFALLAFIAIFSERHFFFRYYPNGKESLRAHPVTNGSYAIKIMRDGPTYAGAGEWLRESGVLSKYLFYQGVTSITASDDSKVDPDEVLSGILAAVFAPSLEKAAVLGVGTGITAGSVAQFFEQTTAIEINRPIINLLDFFDSENFYLRENERASIIHDDARAHFLRSSETYDVILNSVSVPSFESASKIYTKEFFELARSALKADGVYLTWVGLGMNDLALRSILSSLKNVFTDCFATLLRPGYVMLACTNNGPALSPRGFDRLQPPSSVEEAMQHAIPLSGSLGEYISARMLGPKFLDSLGELGAPNTDDFPIVEFSAWDRSSANQLLHDWPVINSEFMKRNYVTGRELSSEELSDRCRLYYQGLLPATLCEEHLITDIELKKAEALEKAAIALSTTGRSRGKMLEEALSFVDRAIKGLSGDDELDELRRSLLFELANAYPLVLSRQVDAAVALENRPEFAQESKNLRYRKMILSSRYRKFEEPK